MHFNFSESATKYALRPAITEAAHAPENQQERPPEKGPVLHCSGLFSWFHKGPFIFYHDEAELPDMQIRRPRKPWHSKYELDEEYHHCVDLWEASLPKDSEIKPSDNSMTNKYYTESILPGLCDQAEMMRKKYGRGILQEDNDSSHGTRSDDNLAKHYKEERGIELLLHPAQSPDLNPIESMWSILKNWVRWRDDWNDIESLKQVLQEEWDKIMQEKLLCRIRRMPDRCMLLRSND